MPRWKSSGIGRSLAQDLIVTRALTRTYENGSLHVEALRGIDLTIQSGEYVAIMGPSGSGKSTFINILGCLDRPTAGEYLLEGVAISSLDDNLLAELRGEKLGFVFQSFHLLPRMSALKNVEVPLIYTNRPPRLESAEAALASVGLADRVHHKPDELSGGQQQRVAIARALVNNPTIILADEPTGNLDSTTGEEILQLFESLNAQGKTIVIVTHEEEVASRCHRTIRFRDGLVAQDDRRVTHSRD